MLRANEEWVWYPREREGALEGDRSFWRCEPLPGVCIYIESSEDSPDPEADRVWDVSLVWGDEPEPVYEARCPGTAAEAKAYLLDNFGQDLLVVAAQLLREPVIPVLTQLHTHTVPSPHPKQIPEHPQLLGLDIFGRVWKRRGKIWERLRGSLL